MYAGRAPSERDLAALPLPRRLALRAAYLLGRPWLLWTLAAVFAARDLFFTVLERERPDTATFWSGGRELLLHPNHLYDLSSAWLRAEHMNPLPGGLEGFISPPTVALLFTPLAGLSKGTAVGIWTVFDAGCTLAGLVVLWRHLCLTGPARQVFWVLAAFFPPLFAEFDAGQVGGPILLLFALGLGAMPKRPLRAGVLIGAATAIKFYPAAVALAAPRAGRVRAVAATAATASVLLAGSFLPLGLGQIPTYVRSVLVPTLTPGNEDCALVSTTTMVARYVGGRPWAVPGDRGLIYLHVPWGSPAAASVVGPLLAFALFASALWSLRRSRGATAFGAAVMFALGGLIPGTVFPYQLLTLLPLTLVLGVKATQDADGPMALWMAACLAFFLKAPCATPVANLWTFGALGLLALACYQAPRFRVAA